jgi:hypothetical protein
MIREQPDTPSLKLAKEYMKLGGTRRAVVDDNIVSTRDWEGEPDAATQFWADKIETLVPEKRQEVELHLPTINAT